MRLNTLFATVCITFCLSQLVAQNQINPGDPVEQNKNTKASPLSEQEMEGTYEIIQHGKKPQIFTTDLLVEIEKRRDDLKEVFYEVSPYVTIRIFPRAVINARKSQK